MTNVEVLELDARHTRLPAASFDAVTSRLVLVNVPQPNEVLVETVRIVRPGGWVAFHEADYVSHVCDPPLEAWSAIVDLIVTYSERNGIDPFIGRKLPRLMRAAGIVDIVVNPILHTYPPGHRRRYIFARLRSESHRAYRRSRLNHWSRVYGDEGRTQPSPC